MRHFSATVALTLCAALFAGCSGGGSSQSSVPAAPKAGTSSKLTLTIKKLTLPKVQPSSKTRTTKSFSSVGAGLQVVVLDANNATLSTVTIDLTGQTPQPADMQCVPDTIFSTCSFGVNAPSKSAAIRVSVCPDSACAQPPLDQGTVLLTPANFTPGAANAVTVTMTGVAASIQVFAQNPAPFSGGGPTTVPLVVQVFDAEGAAILGPDTYSAPVVVSESNSTHTLLTAMSVLNLQQQAVGDSGGPQATPAPFTPPSPGPSVSIASRYIQPVLNFDGSGTTPTTITATLGTITSPGLIITPTTTSPNTAVSTGNIVTFPSSSTQLVLGTSVDANGNIWANYGGSGTTSAAIQQLNSTTLQPTGPIFSLTPAGVFLATNFKTGPDGNLWATFCTPPASGGGCLSTSPGGYVQFNITTHVFAYFPTKSGTVFSFVPTATSLVGTEELASNIAVLPFNGSTPGTVNEVTFAPPAGLTGTPASLPEPRTITTTGNGKIWVTEHNTLVQTFITQIDAGGNKIPGTENPLNSGSTNVTYVALAAPTSASSTTIMYTDIAENGELYTYDTAAKTFKGIAAPSLNLVPIDGQGFGVFDPKGNFWYLSFDEFGNGEEMNRIDANTGRIDSSGVFFQIGNTNGFTNGVSITNTQIIVGGLAGPSFQTSAIETFTF